VSITIDLQGSWPEKNSLKRFFFFLALTLFYLVLFLVRISIDLQESWPEKTASSDFSFFLH
jgi:hypothetical protein